MNKAVFLDRDGVINEDGSFLYKPGDIHFLDGIFPFCRRAQEKGYLLVIATNQSGIARGYYTEDDFWKLMDWMCGRFEAEGVHIRKVYCCPFHGEKGVGIYKVDSEDRKPKPGMLLKAAREFDIDMAASVMLGDRDSDMQAGRAAGVGKLVLMPGVYACSPAPDVTVIRSLAEAEPLL